MKVLLIIFQSVTDFLNFFSVILALRTKNGIDKLNNKQISCRNEAGVKFRSILN